MLLGRADYVINSFNDFFPNLKGFDLCLLIISFFWPHTDLMGGLIRWSHYSLLILSVLINIAVVMGLYTLSMNSLLVHCYMCEQAIFIHCHIYSVLDVKMVIIIASELQLDGRTWPSNSYNVDLLAWQLSASTYTVCVCVCDVVSCHTNMWL